MLSLAILGSRMAPRGKASQETEAGMKLQAKPYLRSVTLLREKVKDFSKYPFCLPAITDFESVTFHPDVTFFVGDNGSGKSTLIEAIAILLGFNAEGGSRNFNFSTEASHSPLHRFMRATRSHVKPRDGYFLRAESFYNVASNIDQMDREPAFGPPIIDSYGGKSLHKQSHGESFWALLTERLRGNGIYVLDEPESALSPVRQMAMLTRMQELVDKKSQFIIATHSPILLAYPSSRIYELRDGKLHETPYEETQHFQVAKRFFGNYRRCVEEL
jgi:predicted ATPase